MGFAASLTLSSLFGDPIQQWMTNWNPNDPFDLGVWMQLPPRKKQQDYRSVDTGFDDVVVSTWFCLYVHVYMYYYMMLQGPAHAHTSACSSPFY